MARQGGKRSAEEQIVLFPDQIESVRYTLSLVRSRLNQHIQDQEVMQVPDLLHTVTYLNKAMRILHGEPE